MKIHLLYSSIPSQLWFSHSKMAFPQRLRHYFGKKTSFCTLVWSARQEIKINFLEKFYFLVGMNRFHSKQVSQGSNSEYIFVLIIGPEDLYLIHWDIRCLASDSEWRRGFKVGTWPYLHIPFKTTSQKRLLDYLEYLQVNWWGVLSKVEE